jgi:hypothetical protein
MGCKSNHNGLVPTVRLMKKCKSPYLTNFHLNLNFIMSSTQSPLDVSSNTPMEESDYALRTIILTNYAENRLHSFILRKELCLGVIYVQSKQTKKRRKQI